MSEFYEMDMDMDMDQDQDSTKNLHLFKNKYYLLKEEIRLLSETLIIFDSDFHVTSSEISQYLTIENIMELSRIVHDYFLCQDHSVLLCAQHILDKLVIIDNSPKDEVDIYISAYLFMNIESEPHKHQNLFDLILDVSNYYEMYVKGQEKMVFEMISLEETLSNVNI